MRYLVVWCFGSIMLVCSACSSASEPGQLAEFSSNGQDILVRNLHAGSEHRFTLVSLRDRSIVPNSDSATTKWDIGFRKTTIIVNGGKIRAGRGGIQRLQNQRYDELREAPLTGYRGDDAEDNLALTPRSGESWYLYSGTSITPLKDVVLVLRTGDGTNFAKLEVQSYYKNMVEPSITAPARYYSFRYQIQTNGSRQFP